MNNSRNSILCPNCRKLISSDEPLCPYCKVQNPGSRHVVDRILPGLDFDETRFIANLSGATVAEYAEITRIFDDSPVDAMEINISCPNVKEGGVQFGNVPEMSARVVAAYHLRRLSIVYYSRRPSRRCRTEEEFVSIQAVLPID